MSTTASPSTERSPSLEQAHQAFVGQEQAAQAKALGTLLPNLAPELRTTLPSPV